MPAAAQTNPYGGASLSAVHLGSRTFLEDEELDSSGLSARGYGGVRIGPSDRQSRLEVSSTYRSYTRAGLKDRWSNSAEAEQRFRLGKDIVAIVEARAATNLSTLEVRSADQLSGQAQLVYQPSEAHRLRVAAAYRRRYYDGSDARSSAPMLDADYRYRLGRYNYVDFDVRREWVDSTDNLLDYTRTSLGAYYTHPIARGVRARAGIVHRRWTWDDRLAPDGPRRRDRLLAPQLRLTHDLTDVLELELDYRRLIRRSNDDQIDRNGNRLAATVRARF